jgi:Putative Actinobacterial Holin-X, holin superfamily III
MTSSETRQEARDLSQATVGQLVGEATQDLSLLMRQELALAKTELRQEAMKAGKAYGMLGGAGFAGYMVLLFASIAAWWGLATVVPNGWAALIVTAAWAVIGAVLYRSGRRQMREVHPVPQRTTETLKELPETLKGAASR